MANDKSLELILLKSINELKESCRAVVNGSQKEQLDRLNVVVIEYEAQCTIVLMSNSPEKNKEALRLNSEIKELTKNIRELNML